MESHLLADFSQLSLKNNGKRKKQFFHARHRSYIKWVTQYLIKIKSKERYNHDFIF